MRRVRLTITIKKEIVDKVDSLIDGQKIRNRSHAIETVLSEKFRQRLLETAVVLGGENQIEISGKKIPEILIPVGNKTLLEKNIETLRTFGIRKIILALGKMEKEVVNFLKNKQDSGAEIVLRKNRGTGGILREAKNEIKKTFLMMNGDILLESIDIEDMYRFHKNSGGVATISVAVAGDPSQLGSIFMKGSRITDFKDKPRDTKNQSLLVNAGVYILEPRVLSLAKDENIMIERDIFPRLTKKGGLFGYQIGRDWIHLHDEKMYSEYINNFRATSSSNPSA